MGDHVLRPSNPHSASIHQALGALHYTTITKAQWAFPAILAAYDAVAPSPEATARPRSKLSCREVCLAEPDDTGADDLICDFAFPLG